MRRPLSPWCRPSRASRGLAVALVSAAVLALPLSLMAAPKKKGPTRIPWPKGLARAPVVASAAPGEELGPEASATSFLSEMTPSDYVQRVKWKRGSVVVLALWATWCPTCKKEMPVLDELARTYVPRGVAFYSVSLDEDEDVVKSYLRAHPTWMQPIWEVRGPQDAQATALRTLGAEPSNAIPRIVILHKSGALAADLKGGYPAVTLQRQLDALLGEAAQ